MALLIILFLTTYSVSEGFQSDVLCVLNAFIREDLQTPTVKEEIRHYSSQDNVRLSVHPNDTAVNRTVQSDNWRLRRHMPNDLSTRFTVQV
jgi:hypothetical protein